MNMELQVKRFFVQLCASVLYNANFFAVFLSLASLQTKIILCLYKY